MILLSAKLTLDFFAALISTILVFTSASIAITRARTHKIEVSENIILRHEPIS